MAQPRTKLPIPEPSGSEFENFDRLMGILLSKPKPKPKPEAKPGRAKRQRRRLPRP